MSAHKTLVPIPEAAESLRAVFTETLAAVLPSNCLPPFVPEPSRGRTVVVGAGKAAAAMARTFEDSFAGSLSGVVVVPGQHEVPCHMIEVLTAAHPVPDARSVAASRHLLASVASLTAADQVVCLLSGGASSLLCLPAAGLSLEQKQALTHELLMVGADIRDINTVRKHLSAIKGGRLAMAMHPAHCLTLAISDVVGDDPAVIGSAPTLPDAGTSNDALAVLKKYAMQHHKEALAWLRNPASESPKPEHHRLGCEYKIIASARDALGAAQLAGERRGWLVQSLGVDLAGDARRLAREHAEMVRRLLSAARPDKPLMLLSGGETTVCVTGNGRGGRNTEYLLALARAMDGQAGVYALACDTDGIDGYGGHAGAMYWPAQRAAWLEQALRPSSYAASNDSAGFFARLGGLVDCGPTLTNVNDFRAILIMPEAWGA